MITIWKLILVITFGSHVETTIIADFLSSQNCEKSARKLEREINSDRGSKVAIASCVEVAR